MEQQQTCSGCRFARPSPQSIGRVLEFRARPPVVLIARQGLVSAFPQVLADAWCGLWAPEESAVLQAVVSLVKPAADTMETPMETPKKTGGKTNGN